MALIARTGIRKGNRKPRHKSSADVPTTKETAADKARRLAHEAQRQQKAAAADRDRQAQKAEEERQQRDAATEAEAAKNIGKIYEETYAHHIEVAAEGGRRSVTLQLCKFRGWQRNQEDAIAAAPPRDRAVLQHLPAYLEAEGFITKLIYESRFHPYEPPIKDETPAFDAYSENIFTLDVSW
jgi:hypothetical protein